MPKVAGSYVSVVAHIEDKEYDEELKEKEFLFKKLDLIDDTSKG